LTPPIVPIPILILVACRDLMFRSKIDVMLRHSGITPGVLRASDDPAAVLAAGRPSAIILDLRLGPERWRPIVAEARAATPPIPILAFGPHIDRAAQAAARAAGCTLVVANSRLSRDLPALIQQVLDDAS